MSEHDKTSRQEAPDWVAPARPGWLEAVNREGECFDLEELVPLTADSLIRTASASAELEDFGEDYWREPLDILCRDLNASAELTLMGRLMARNDLLIWLKNRLLITDLYKQSPEIAEQSVHEPFFIVGLPRSGTSILFELLSLSDDFGVATYWEALFPCPPPTADTYRSDARIARADALVTQWNRVTPEFATMHEMGGSLPAECGLIMANSLISDHIAALHQTPGYAAFYESADLRPAYEMHRDILKILQWRNPRKRWLLKAPAHQNHLDTLLSVYPDARIIQTHRDPLRCMASATSLMGTLYYMRSDKAFEAKAFEDFLKGEATAQRLERVMDQRASGTLPEEAIYDSSYQRLMDEPVAAVRRIYEYFGMPFDDELGRKMTSYLASKPKDASGKHDYAVDANPEQRRFFQRYQREYDVPDEA